MSRILILDDDGVVLRQLAEGMRAQGYQVDTAQSGEEALQLARQERFDLAVLGIRLPGLSGVELTRALKDTSDTPFVFLSDQGDAQAVREATEAGALGLLTKPVATSQLAPFVEVAMARGRDFNALHGANAQLERALQVEQKTRTAVGIIMESRKLDSAGAFDLLRRHARNQQRKVVDVAQELICAMETAYKTLCPEDVAEGNEKNSKGKSKKKNLKVLSTTADRY